MMRQFRFLALVAVVGFVCRSSLVHATPYASNVVKTGTTVTYTLNEDADTLKVSINGGAFNPVGDGTLKGAHTITLGSATDTFSIQAEKTSTVGYTITTGATVPVTYSSGTDPNNRTSLSLDTPASGFNQLNNDADVSSKWNSPRGIDVNKSPNTANFGTIYIGNSTPGAVGTAHSRGVFGYRADMSIGLGNPDGLTGYNPKYSDNVTDAFSTVSAANSPYHLTVAADGSLWEAGFSDVNSNVLILDPNLSAATIQNLFPFLGGGLSNTPSGVGIGPAASTGTDPLTGATGVPISPDGTNLSPYPGLPTLTTTAVQNHGSVYSVVVQGSLAAGNLVVYTIDEDMTSEHVVTAGIAPSLITGNPDYNRNGTVGAEDYVYWRANKDTTPALNGDQGYVDWRNGYSGKLNDRNSVWKYDIGNNGGNPIGSGITALPTKVADGLIGDLPSPSFIDLNQGADGKLYFSQGRNAGSQVGLIVVDPSGNLLFNSLTASRTLLGDPGAFDILTTLNQFAISPDQKYLAGMLNYSDVLILPLVGGIPDLANRLVVPTNVNGATHVNSGRDIAFDAAGNIYYVSSGQGLLRILAPGGHTQTTLSWNGTAYAFNSTTLPGAGSFGGVPEPASIVLALAGLAFAVCQRRRK